MRTRACPTGSPAWQECSVHRLQLGEPAVQFQSHFRIYNQTRLGRLTSGAARQWLRRARAESWATSRSTARTKVWVSVIGGMSGCDSCQVPLYMVLVTGSALYLSPQSYGAVFSSIARTMISKSATWVQAYL